MMPTIKCRFRTLPHSQASRVVERLSLRERLGILVPSHAVKDLTS
jgi:hypothetical protein